MAYYHKKINPATGKPYMGRKPKISKRATLQSQKASFRIEFKLSHDDLQRLENVWQNRSYPHPANPSKEVRFNTRAQYLAFIIRAMNNLSPTEWYLIKHIKNPDYPED